MSRNPVLSSTALGQFIPCGILTTPLMLQGERRKCSWFWVPWHQQERNKAQIFCRIKSSGSKCAVTGKVLGLCASEPGCVGHLFYLEGKIINLLRGQFSVCALLCASPCTQKLLVLPGEGSARSQCCRPFTPWFCGISDAFLMDCLFSRGCRGASLTFPTSPRTGG